MTRTGIRTRALAALTVLPVLALAACGSDEPARTNELRPPAPIFINASVTPSRVTLSPSRFGAGPVTIVVANLTGASQRVTFASDTLSGESGAPVRQTTAPINPNDTATIQAEAEPGNYIVKVAGDAIAPADITVGPERRSSQNDLMLP
jgi:hypothetical protein